MNLGREPEGKKNAGDVQWSAYPIVGMFFLCEEEELADLQQNFRLDLYLLIFRLL